MQLVDVVARTRHRPRRRADAVVVGTIADAVGVYRYTVLGGGHIAPDPAWVAAHIATEPVPILGAVTCNKAIFPQLIAALQEVQARGLADKIHPGEYAGCYYPRFIAGTTTLSNHAFGLALDINAIENQRGTAGQMDRGVVQIFEKWGFTWGGDWRYTDPMHFEMNRVVKPQVAALPADRPRRAMPPGGSLRACPAPPAGDAAVDQLPAHRPRRRYRSAARDRGPPTAAARRPPLHRGGRRSITGSQVEDGTAPRRRSDVTRAAPSCQTEDVENQRVPTLKA